MCGGDPKRYGSVTDIMGVTMERESKEQFQKFFIEMVSQMTDPEHFVREELIKILIGICDLLRVEKCVTEFYQSVTAEKAGQGEILCDRNTGKGDQVIVEIRFVAKSGAVVKAAAYSSSKEPPLDEEEKDACSKVMRAIMSFVSRNRLQNAVEKFAFFDEEGYPNVRSYYRFLSELYEAGKLPGHTAICFNLRHFSVINDKVGRKNGDAVMKAYLELLAISAGSHNTICRIGGDNFIMTANTNLLNGVLDVLRGTMVAYGPDPEDRIKVSASAGVFEIPDDYVMHHPGEMMDRTYTVMQIAKRGEEDVILFYDDKIAKMRQRAMIIQQQFPDALKNGEFKVFYQPKVNVETGEIVGAEALCRWIKDGKVVPPMDFIPILEQTADICKLDFYVLDQVCRDIRRWQEEGRRVVRISANISRKHLNDEAMSGHIMEIIDRNKIPHQYIETELTETTTDVKFKDLIRVVNDLNSEDICTSVDDFGMGYSSLNLIREIPWRVLKIDRCFLPKDEDDENSVTSVMYRHVVAMARNLGLECVTEGVETVAQIEILKNNGCHIAQGFYFDRPLPVEEFEAKLDHNYYKDTKEE